MKKKLIVAIVIPFISLIAMAQTSGITDNNPAGKPRSISSKSQWDLTFNYDINTPSGIVGLSGAECDGTYIYSTKWRSNTIVKFDLQGNFIESFTIDGVSGLRDLAFDGSYMYGGAAGTTVYVMDFTTKSLIRSFTAPTSTRAIAYNASHNSLYANNWSSNIIEFDLYGNSLGTAIVSPPGLYGLAWDGYTEGGPFLWAFTGTTTGGGCQIEQINLNTGALTGVSHSVSGDLGSGCIAGGLYLFENASTGKYYIGGTAQDESVSDQAFAYEIGSTPVIPVPLNNWALITGMVLCLLCGIVILKLC